ncbi:MAG: carbamoyltransferase HypF, partial [Planctomycetales bacterium]|nr:carbamoyltransferase HypF [Planctomycetales bacterium]
AQDIAICADCFAELSDPTDRRYQYPFINCTNCGPRFTIVKDLPYDRPMTTMVSFPMCRECEQEYHDPTSRRFHAQPNACPVCGPTIWFIDGPNSDGTIDTPGPHTPQGHLALDAFADAIHAGNIVAAKGVGGVHLACDATNRQAIATLRERKGRVEKPFAVMVSSVEQARQFAAVTEQEAVLLESKERPIVLLPKKHSTTFQAMLENVAPGNDFIGVLLPYSPLHYLLVERTSPLLLTSGNISDEPIVRTNSEAVRRLSHLADCFLLHNRDIHVVCDDSVVRCVDEGLLPIRRSRGYAPLPVRLSEDGPSVMAVGGEIKATFCVTKGTYAYLSQHIGDVGNLETLEALQRNVDHFVKLFRIDVQAVAGDLHPDNLSTRWAQQLASTWGVPFVPVQHHFAHAASLIAELAGPRDRSMIVCSFDGTGFGTDGAIWGGEFLLASRGGFERIAHLNYFPLLGGDASIRYPYRTALALLDKYALPWDERLSAVNASPPSERRLLRRQIEKGINTAQTSSMGRLFDAVASLLGIRHTITYEAQAAMELEALATTMIDHVSPSAYSFAFSSSHPRTVDYGRMLDAICSDVLDGVDQASIAAQFHHATARMVVDVCEAARRDYDVNTVGLTGGVFQNVLLLRLVQAALRTASFEVVSHTLVPPNDGGIALGQAVVARHVVE